MKKYLISFLVTIILITLVIFGAVFLSQKMGYGSASTLATPSCTISTVTAATVGHQVSSTILASNGRRAWAIIEQPLNATNTLSINFGAAATVNSGIQLPPATTTNESDKITLGLDTDFPYTGDVMGITNNGSTTVRITQCVY